jgi:hypothetical protein
MASLANGQREHFIEPPTPLCESCDPQSYASLEKLARLHVEAEETARLANLLGGSLHTSLALALLAPAGVVLLGGTSVFQEMLWLAFALSAALAMFYRYARTIRRPFARLRLKRFAASMSATLIYTGFAWGAGAYLSLPPGAGLAEVLASVAVPAVAIMLTLREREATFLFLAPSGLLTAFACVFNSFAEGVLGAAAVVTTCAVLCALAIWRDPRRFDGFFKPAMLPLK